MGMPCVSGTSIDVDVVVGAWWSGASVSEIETDLPGIDRAAVLVACWFVARYGSAIWKRRFERWVAKAEGMLWHASRVDVSDIPLPPQHKVSS